MDICNHCRKYHPEHMVCDEYIEGIEKGKVMASEFKSFNRVNLVEGTNWDGNYTEPLEIPIDLIEYAALEAKQKEVDELVFELSNLILLVHDEKCIPFSAIELVNKHKKESE